MSEFTPLRGEPPAPLNPYDSSAAQRGRSGGAKVLLGVAIGCGALVLLCCGVFGFSAFYFGRTLQQAISQDPATVRRVAGSIVDLQIPDALSPKESLDFDVPVVGRMSLAVFGDLPQRSHLVLFQAEEGVDPDVLEVQLEQALEQTAGREIREVDRDELREAETFETRINGQGASFLVGLGTGGLQNREIYQANGEFRGKSGSARLLVQLDAEDFTKEQVLDVLKSMH